VDKLQNSIDILMLLHIFGVVSLSVISSNFSIFMN